MAVLLKLEGTAVAEKALGRRLTRDARALLATAGLGSRELSLVLTDDLHMRALNHEWRGEDWTTDVLSFPMDEALPGQARPKVGPLGDIVLSVETTAREAAELGWQGELFSTFLLVHGFCHLLGHDHADPDEATAMKTDEDRFFAVLAPGVTRPPTPY